MAANSGQSTRQKMINLMYLVFIAMLALNVSTEVLNGFDLINDNLLKDIENASARNKQIYEEINTSYNNNPEKTEKSYFGALEVKEQTDSLFNYIQSLKIEIAKKSDGKDADINNLKSKDNLDASSEVMLSPINGQGKKLKSAVDGYRDRVNALVIDPAKKEFIATSLSTEPSARAKKDLKNWIQASFENMPSIAVMTYLSELQSNIKMAEGEALTNLLKNIDVSDYRVNELQAFVIPESNIVMQGMPYNAKIVLAAVDTTQRPRIVVDGKEIENGSYQALTGRPGTFQLKGMLELGGIGGQTINREFTREYTVIEPMATVAPLLMNVLYAGIENEMSISVPGVVHKDIIASATGGTLTAKGNIWVAKPSQDIGGKFMINVAARVNGSQRTIAQKEFRIRALPDPTAYVSYKDAGGAVRAVKAGGTIPRSALINSGGIRASIDDGVLDLPFTVVSFRTETVDAMGNAMPLLSEGSNFSGRQVEQIRELDRGRKLFITEIKVKGPDGRERTIGTLDLKLN